jgi:catechol 2,3-dioxygenase-like lactoylglutathione lyase family enzyme
MELSQVRLLVTDFGVMFRFYRDVLGFKPQQNDERGPYGKLSPPSGSVAIALQARAHFRQTVPGIGNGAPDNVVLALKVDDLDATVGTLRALGVELLAEPSIEWGRIKVAHLRDPEQNLLELQQWLTPAK